MTVRVPIDAEQRSDLKPITIPNLCRSRLRRSADHLRLCSDWRSHPGSGGAGQSNSWFADSSFRRLGCRRRGCYRAGREGTCRIIPIRNWWRMRANSRGASICRMLEPPEVGHLQLKQVVVQRMLRKNTQSGGCRRSVRTRQVGTSTSHAFASTRRRTSQRPDGTRSAPAA